MKSFMLYTVVEQGVVVRAFGLYWVGIRFEYLPTRHCWALNKSFIPSLVVWSMTKKLRIWWRKTKQKEQRYAAAILIKPAQWGALE